MQSLENETYQRGTVWQKIWDRKHADHQQSLHQSDGFDLLDASQFSALVHPFVEWMGPLNNNLVLEVGCGTGAFAKHLSYYKKFFGIDYSESAIQRISREFEGCFKVAEANKIPFNDQQFDCVYSFGVFFYFDSLDYAKNCLLEQLRVLKPGGQIFIFEINDEEKLELYQEIRSKEQRKKHQKTDVHIDHIFYNKKFFTDFGRENNLKVEIRDESKMQISFHTGASYRFAVSFKS